jgi:DNA polymerase-3 subunit chi
MAVKPEILFYQLNRSAIERVLPDLLQKSLDRGWRAVVQAADGERVDALDQALWTFDDQSFLPHGRQADPEPAEQPVLLTETDDNQNQAQVRVLVDGAKPSDLSDLERAVFLIDGRDSQAVNDAEQASQQYAGAGHDVTFWREAEAGGWEKVPPA